MWSPAKITYCMHDMIFWTICIKIQHLLISACCSHILYIIVFTLQSTVYEIHHESAMDPYWSHNDEERADLSIQFTLCFFVIITFVLFSVVIWLSVFPLLNNCFIIQGADWLTEGMNILSNLIKIWLIMAVFIAIKTTVFGILFSYTSQLRIPFLL